MPRLTSSEITPWSALTCQRFGRLRPVATTVWLSLFKHRRQAASDQSADRSAHSKKLPLLLVQSFLQFAPFPRPQESERPGAATRACSVAPAGSLQPIVQAKVAALALGTGAKFELIPLRHVEVVC